MIITSEENPDEKRFVPEMRLGKHYFECGNFKLRGGKSAAPTDALCLEFVADDGKVNRNSVKIRRNAVLDLRAVRFCGNLRFRNQRHFNKIIYRIKSIGFNSLIKRCFSANS